jgi:hypothetical protein
MSISVLAENSEALPMSSRIFDTLAYAKKLKSVGFTEEQAEVQAEAMAEIIDDKLATKRDLRDLQKSTTDEFKKFRHDLHAMEERLTYELTIRLGTMLIGAITLLAVLIKIL